MTKTHHEDRAWLNLFTVNRHIDQGIFYQRTSLCVKRRPFQQLNDDGNI